MAPSGWVSEALVSQSGWSCSALCEYKPPALGQPQYPPKQTHTLRGQAEQSFHDPFSNKTRLWLSFWQERKKGGILLRHAQWEGFSKGTSEGPTRWTLGLHLRLSHISFPSSPPSFPLPSTRFTSSLLVYKVAVQSARAVMEAHTRTQEHRGWHSARAGCCRKGPLRQQPGCKAHSMKVSLLQSTSTLSNLQAAPQTRLTSVPYTQDSSKATSDMRWVQRDPAQSAGTNRLPARHLYRPPKATTLMQRWWWTGRRKEWKDPSALIAVGFGADLMRKIIPGS